MEDKPITSNATLIAVISYLSLVGWIIAYIMYQNDKSEFAIYHIRQALGMNIMWIIGWTMIRIPFIGWIAAILVFVLWLSGLIYALQGEKRPVYLIGDFFQELFSSIR